jgi:hypothetical protein
MKTLASLLLISATFAGASAYATPNVEPNNVPFQGVYRQADAHAPTRAQVVAELQAARAAGQVIRGEIEEPVAAAADSTLTREQVQAEAASIHENGPVAFGGEGYLDTGA